MTEIKKTERKKKLTAQRREGEGGREREENAWYGNLSF